MPSCPLVAMKSKKAKSLEAVGMELDRRAHTYVNDVDRSRSAMNVNYFVRAEDETRTRPLPLEQALERRMGELHTKRAVRSDAVKAMGFVISTNDALDDATAHKFMEEALHWFGCRYGYENILAASEHFDEGTPHLHFWLAPVVRGEDGFDRLTAKTLFAPDERRRNRETDEWEVVAQGTMSQLQRDFWREVASKYGYNEPLDHARRAKGYRSLEAFKNHEGVTRELKAQIAGLERERAEAVEAQGEARAVLEGLKGEVSEKRGLAADLADEVEEKAAERDELAAQVADFSEKLAQTRAALADAHAELGKAADELEGAKAEAERARGQAAAAQMGTRQAKAECARAKEETATAKQEARKAREEAEGLRRELESLRAAYEGLRRRVDVFVQAVGGHLAALAQAREGKAFFCDAIAAFKENPLIREARDLAAEWVRNGGYYDGGIDEAWEAADETVLMDESRVLADEAKALDEGENTH